MSEWVRSTSEAFDPSEVLEIIRTTTAGVSLVEDRNGKRVWVSSTLLMYVEQCSALTHAGTLETPPEYCEEWALQGDDYCALHVGHGGWGEGEVESEGDTDQWKLDHCFG